MIRQPLFCLRSVEFGDEFLAYARTFFRACFVDLEESLFAIRPQAKAHVYVLLDEIHSRTPMMRASMQATLTQNIACQKLDDSFKDVILIPTTNSFRCSLRIADMVVLSSVRNNHPELVSLIIKVDAFNLTVANP